jgi:hypothetical protein
MQIYGIIGTFFQNGEGLVLVHSAESESGTHAEIREQAMSLAFSGHFHIYNNTYGEGVMLDAYGPANLLVTTLTATELIFEKRYIRTDTTVTYTMSKQDDDVWSGGWSSVQSGFGQARCKLIELPESMFNIDPEGAVL